MTAVALPPDAAVGHKVIGRPMDRVDGPLKVRGAATYASDVTYPDMTYAALVQSTVAAGRIRRIDTSRAKVAPGVVAVITHENSPALDEPPPDPFFPSSRYPLKDDTILHYGQHVGIVVAESRPQALAAARLITVEYDETAPLLGIENADAEIVRNPFGLEHSRGDVAAALAGADIVYDQTFHIAAESNNPMGLFATVALWDGDHLVVHDATQFPKLVRQVLATHLGLPVEKVRVLVPYLGGGFGAGLRTWPHTILTAVAARMVGRPVKIVLSRPQMFDSTGHRPETRQRLRLGATRAGELVAIDHEATSTRGIAEFNVELITFGTPAAYACPNVATHDAQVKLNIPSPNAMRGPGSVEANLAIESALDELSYQLQIDPIELRLRNYAEVHPESGLPWSGKALRDCYRVGAQRFGWAKRDPRVGSMRNGRFLVGYGMAGVSYEWYVTPCQAKLSIGRDGRAHLRSAATDIGTGTYTIATQMVAELLGIDPERVEVLIGDTDLPPAPQSGGSGLAASLAGAIEDAAANLRRKFDELRGGRTGESYADILTRHGLDELSADGERTPHPEQASVAPSPAFAAQFAEVHIDPDLGLVRVARMVTAVDGGRILNEKLARSQVTGAVVMGIGMTLLEDTAFDATGRIANATLGDYLVPVNADVPDLDVVFVGEPDRFNALGVKGVGEIGIIGVAAAIANAVYHATGRRFRSLPITIDQLL
jgi:xanthine dehydrogenase YagR molybdenum-binding subunit